MNWTIITQTEMSRPYFLDIMRSLSFTYEEFSRRLSRSDKKTGEFPDHSVEGRLPREAFCLQQIDTDFKGSWILYYVVLDNKETSFQISVESQTHGSTFTDSLVKGYDGPRATSQVRQLLLCPPVSCEMCVCVDILCVCVCVCECQLLI